MLPASRPWLASLLFLALSAAATYYMRLSPASTAVGPHFEKIMTDAPFVFPNSNIILRRTYTGIKPLDQGLAFLVAAFLPGAAGLNKAFQLQQIYFLASFAPVLGIWSIEAARNYNSGALITFTSIWALFYQTVGGAIIIPLWYIALTITSSKQAYWTAKDDIPTAKARGLLLALIFGYAIPTGAMYLPSLSLDAQQALVAFWQSCPLFVNLLWYGFTKAMPDRVQDASESRFYVKLIYRTTIFAATVAHIGTIVACVMLPDVSLKTVLLPLTHEEWTMDQSLHFIFQIDFWFIFAAALAACYIAIWDLSHFGVTTVGTGSGIFELTTVALLLGPGAAAGLGWYWREKGMYQVAQKAKAKKT